MSMGALAVVEEWSDAVNRGDGQRLLHLSDQDVEVVGPRGSVRGRQVLSDWLTRAGFSSESRRWFCGGDGDVVVEQDAMWVDLATGEELGRAVVAAQFLVKDGVVASYQRHDDLSAALAAAGLDEERDEVSSRSTG
jgi:hypothetical protein